MFRLFPSNGAVSSRRFDAIPSSNVEQGFLPCRVAALRKLVRGRVGCMQYGQFWQRCFPMDTKHGTWQQSVQQSASKWSVFSKACKVARFAVSLRGFESAYIGKSRGAGDRGSGAETRTSSSRPEGVCRNDREQQACRVRPKNVGIIRPTTRSRHVGDSGVNFAGTPRAVRSA